MPTFEVSSPDGRKFRVEAPDGATQEDAIAYIQAQQAPAKPSDPTDGMSWYDKFAAGVGKAVTDTGRGALQGLQTLVSAPKGAELIKQADIDEAKRLDAPLMNTGAGTLGNVTGNLAMLVGPGAALSAAGKALQAPRAAALAQGLLAPKTIAGGAAGGAALSGIQPVASDESRLLNMTIGGGVGGAVTGAFNGVARLLGPKAALLTPDQQALVQRALDMGYDLKPSELTGKRWQQNLEAAMAQHPVTSGRMQDIGRANQATSDRLVSDALESAGGAIDQPSAAAAAMEGWQQGMAGEQGRLGDAYRNLLGGVDVNLEQARPTLEALRQQQKQLPKTSQSRHGMEALDDLLGSPGYAKKTQSFVKPPIDESKDDIVTAIRKLGGITPADERIGANVARGLPFNNDPRLGPVWSSKGKPLDDMAEALAQYGYVDRNGLDDILDKLADTQMGKQHFSNAFDHGAAQQAEDPLVGALNELTAKLGPKPKGPSPGYIRQQSPVAGDIAQAMRSDYTDQSAKALIGRDRQLFGEMKSAVDDAIEASLPQGSQGTFQAINKRYGIYAGLNAMSPKQQDVFLNQLYRGSKSPDQFYTFLGMAPDGSFRDVARGFLTKLKEGATDPRTKLVDAAALGRDINKLNPEAMRVLGGDAGKVFRDVGDVGRDVLREQTPNSGTAQRFLYNSLLSGSGVGLGGYFGSDGGAPGAAIGGAVGLLAMPKAVQAAYLSKTLRPLLTGGVKGRKGLLDQELLDVLPYLGRASAVGLLSQ